MHKLVLYYFPSCPYCQKVLNYIDDNDLSQDINFKNTRKDGEAKEELIEVGGKYQVPCLFIDGSPMYESDDIIEWLKKNL